MGRRGLRVQRVVQAPAESPGGGNHGPKGRGPPGLWWLWKELVAVQWSTIRGNLSTGTPKMECDLHYVQGLIVV